MKLSQAIETAVRTLRTAGSVSVLYKNSRYSAFLGVTRFDLTVKTVWLTDLSSEGVEQLRGTVLWPFSGVDPDYVVSFTGTDDEFTDRICSVAAELNR